jgi:hypothetical protein
MKAKKIYSFALKSIKTEQFAMLDDYFKHDEKVMFNHTIGFATDRKTTTIAVFTGFRFEQNNVPFLLIETACYFQIGEENWNTFSKSDTTLSVPQDFMRQLIVVAIGTARGVLHSKTENTFFNRFIIPLLDAEKLIKEDVELEFAAE